MDENEKKRILKKPGEKRGKKRELWGIGGNGSLKEEKEGE